MPSTEKFMFDTIFDELEPIIPELAENDSLSFPEEENELEEQTLQTFSEEEVTEAREKSFSDGQKKGTQSALEGIEKTLIDTLNTIADNLTTLQSEQIKANQEITDDATALALAIVRKFFPMLNKQSAMNEVEAVIKNLLDRLIDDPRIIIKVNPSISRELSDRFSGRFQNTEMDNSFSITADENVAEGNCVIEWSNGTAERNLDRLMREVDEIISQNSTVSMETLSKIKEKSKKTLKDGAQSNNTITKEIGALPREHSDDIFEQNLNDGDLESDNTKSTELSEIDNVTEKNSEPDREQITVKDVNKENKT